MQRPRCGTCQERDVSCEPPSSDNSSTGSGPVSPHPLLANVDSSMLHITEQRRQELLNDAGPRVMDARADTRHTMHYVIRVLKSWPRKIATYGLTQLPPMIHHLQLENGVPLPLAKCSTLVKMWAEDVEAGCGKFAYTGIALEVRRLLMEHTTYSNLELLSAMQSVLILLIILVFNTENPLPSHQVARLLIDVWDMKHRLAKRGLFLEQEMQHGVPPWREWAFMSARRTTIMALHHVEWAWSLAYGYPELLCFELGPLPAPPAKHLWEEDDESRWQQLYKAWLENWKDGLFVLAELMPIRDGHNLNARTEMWLAEADEFGVMVMSEVGVVGW